MVKEPQCRAINHDCKDYIAVVRAPKLYNWSQMDRVLMTEIRYQGVFLFEKLHCFIAICIIVPVHILLTEMMTVTISFFAPFS